MQDKDDVQGLKRLLQTSQRAEDVALEQLLQAIHEQPDRPGEQGDATPSADQVEAARLLSVSAHAVAVGSAKVTVEAANHAARSKAAYEECRRLHEQGQADQ